VDQFFLNREEIQLGQTSALANGVFSIRLISWCREAGLVGRRNVMPCSLWCPTIHEEIKRVILAFAFG
jgi:hypothetical protein